MRVGIITVGSRGDVQPYIALGAGFRRAGHAMRFLTHGLFAEEVRAAGLDFADVGVDPRSVIEQLMGAEGAGGRTTVVRQVLFMRRVLREVNPLQAEAVRASSHTDHPTDE